jgi:hypothetical protein
MFFHLTGSRHAILSDYAWPCCLMKILVILSTMVQRAASKDGIS